MLRRMNYDAREKAVKLCRTEKSGFPLIERIEGSTRAFERVYGDKDPGEFATGRCRRPPLPREHVLPALFPSRATVEWPDSSSCLAAQLVSLVHQQLRLPWLLRQRLDQDSVRPFGAIMQPIVVFCQQRTVALRPPTIQPMVADLKIQQRLEFGRLLNAAIERHYPAVKLYGRARWLHRKTKRKGKELVSYESIRKWLRGKDIPEQPNIRELCQRTGISMSELDPDNSKGDKAGNLSLGELMSLWYAAADDGKAHILSAARLAAAGNRPAGSSDDNSPPLQRSGS